MICNLTHLHGFFNPRVGYHIIDLPTLLNPIFLLLQIFITALSINNWSFVLHSFKGLISSGSNFHGTMVQSAMFIWCLKQLKGCIRYFLSNFYFFAKRQPFRNYEKCFLFNLKSSFVLETFKFL